MDKPQLNLDWPDLIKRLIDLVLPRSDDILTSPTKLGEMLSICTQLAEIEPLVREIATTSAMQKRNILGWTLVHRDGNRYVESSCVRRLLLECPADQLPMLLEAVAKMLGNIGETKWHPLCAAIALLNAVEAVQETGATVFLRRHAKPEIFSESVNKQTQESEG